MVSRKQIFTLAILGEYNQKLENPVETHISHQNFIVILHGDYTKKNIF